MFYQSKIVISQSSNIAKIKKLAILDNFSYEEVILDNGEESIGIEDIQNLSGKLYKKASDEVVLFIVLRSHLMSHEAQNSLLKIIEEPNPNIQIVLHTNILEKILQTIISRCETLFDYSEFEDSEYLDIEFIFKGFLDKSYQEKINVVEKFLKEYHNKNSIKKGILAILNLIVKNPSYSEKSSDLYKAFKSVDVNVSPKLIFDFIVLSLEN